MSRWRTRRATPKPQVSPMPWYCCRRPAPRSTSTAISKSAARASATSSPSCPASRRWCEGRGSRAAASPQLSSPAKAGDPVFQRPRLESLSRGVLDTRFRGYDDLLWLDGVPILKDREPVNPLETILGDQWADPWPLERPCSPANSEIP